MSGRSPERSSARKAPQQTAAKTAHVPLQRLGLPLAERRALGEYLRSVYKNSDEYYTRPEHAWQNLRPHDWGLVWDPFWGDGSCAQKMAAMGFRMVGPTGNFWDAAERPPTFDTIVTNPPFSIKWLVLDTLMEFQRPMAVILPWGSFYTSGADKLQALAKRHRFRIWKEKMPHQGRFFIHGGQLKDISSYILRAEPL